MTPMNITLESVSAALDELNGPGNKVPFIETRWPYTYAYDLVRAFPQVLGLTDRDLARADVAQMLSGNPEGDAICVALARRYCTEMGIAVPPEYAE